MSLVCRQRDRITCDKTGLAGVQTKTDTRGSKHIFFRGKWLLFSFASVAFLSNRIHLSSVF